MSNKPKASRHKRGYTNAHFNLRQQLDPFVQAGKATCVICGQPILPGTPWDLDHSPDRRSWRGASHSSCNRSEGGARGNAKRWAGQAPHWSRVWSQPIPPGTTFNIDGQTVVFDGSNVVDGGDGVPRLA